ncbi:hypothetical protein L7F22_041934, partial [Adiantum nelumboides]|nr:hypothetical protein [Adiantum nelumboides]
MCSSGATPPRGDFQVPADYSTIEALPAIADKVVPTTVHDEETIIITFLGSLIEPVHQTNGVNLAAALAVATNTIHSAAKIKAQPDADAAKGDKQSLTCCCSKPNAAAFPLLTVDVQFRLLHEAVSDLVH